MMARDAMNLGSEALCIQTGREEARHESICHKSILKGEESLQLALRPHLVPEMAGHNRRGDSQSVAQVVLLLNLGRRYQRVRWGA